jgi:hypothetical protein
MYSHWQPNHKYERAARADLGIIGDRLRTEVQSLRNDMDRTMTLTRQINDRINENIHHSIVSIAQVAIIHSWC